jgi:hypothetical protein
MKLNNCSKDGTTPKLIIEHTIKHGMVSPLKEYQYQCPQCKKEGKGAPTRRSAMRLWNEIN